jgi:class 3 adenylate cyclase
MMLGPKIGTEVKFDSNTELFLKDQMIAFKEIDQSFCVGIVDIVNSTQTTAKLSQVKACEYYTVFLNALGYIAEANGATVVKNIGDSILFYFPELPKEKDSFLIPVTCGKKMLEASELINKIFAKRELPKIQYRVSVDYGPLMIAVYKTSRCEDIFGSTVNLCSKINRIAKPSGMTVGNDFYQIIKKSTQHKFREVKKLQTGLRQGYPVYEVNFS